MLLILMYANLWGVHHALHGFDLAHLYRMVSNSHQKRVFYRLLGRGALKQFAPSSTGHACS